MKDRGDVNDDARPCRPSTSTAHENIEAVKKVILDNLQITYRSGHAKQFLLKNLSCRVYDVKL